MTAWRRIRAGVVQMWREWPFWRDLGVDWRGVPSAWLWLVDGTGGSDEEAVARHGTGRTVLFLAAGLATSGPS